ncbi:hypothetical protein J3E64_004146 [Sphingobium sp. OAS761]|nr:hypothetical protein [Sphingobium sp. OAS761]
MAASFLQDSTTRSVRLNRGPRKQPQLHDDSLQPPNDGGGEADGPHEVFDVAVEAGCDAAPVFEAAEHSLDDVALFLDGAVVIVLDLAVFARRNDGFGAALDEPFAQCLAVVSFVRHEFGRRWHCFDAEPCNLAIMHVSGRQEQDAGAAPFVADGVEFGVPSAFRAADTMSQGPLFRRLRSGGP